MIPTATSAAIGPLSQLRSRAPRRRTAADMRRVDVRRIFAALRPSSGRLRLGDADFAIVTTACDFGGRAPGRVRAWALCRCGRRVGVLYAPLDGGHFACRLCWTLRYASDGWHRAQRRRRRAWAIRRRLGQHIDFETYAVTGFRPVPARPPRMSRRTYARLAAELRSAEDAECSARGGRPRGMTIRVYKRTLAAMDRARDGGAVEAAVANLSRTRLAMRRPSRR